MRTFLFDQINAAKREWRFFIFAWIYPLYLYFVMLFMSSLSLISARASLWWLLSDLVIFILFAWLATLPYRRKTATASQLIVWTVVIPVLILCGTALLPFRPLH